MKKLLTVFEFELMSYIKNKTYIVTTILMAVVIGVLMFLPSVFDMSDILGIEQTETEQSAEESTEDTSETEDSDKTSFGIVDQTGYLTETAILEEVFENAEFISMDSKEELKKAVTDEDIEAGFYVTDDSNYKYYVLNREMWDENQAVFDSVLTSIHKQIYCQNNGLNYEKLSEEYEAPVNCDTEVLGKDAADNYWYCYALVIVIFMVIILY